MGAEAYHADPHLRSAVARALGRASRPEAWLRVWLRPSSGAPQTPFLGFLSPQGRGGKPPRDLLREGGGPAAGAGGLADVRVRVAARTRLPCQGVGVGLGSARGEGPDRVQGPGGFGRVCEWAVRPGGARLSRLGAAPEIGADAAGRGGGAGGGDGTGRDGRGDVSEGGGVRKVRGGAWGWERLGDWLGGGGRGPGMGRGAARGMGRGAVRGMGSGGDGGRGGGAGDGGREARAVFPGGPQYTLRPRAPTREGAS